MAPKVLVVLTSHGEILDSSGKPIQKTGWYLPEFAHPYDVLAPKCEIVVASPKGGAAPLDPNSLQPWVKDDSSSANFFNDKKSLWENTAKVSDFLGRADEFDALLTPAATFWAKGKVVAAVCHGPAAFVNVTLPSGENIMKGKEVSAFSNAEEDAVGMSKYMPFALEDKIKEDGAIFQKASEPWAPTVRVSGKLITGQNPNSAKGVGEAIASALENL
ncbi:hypothetical protein K445DRAFT_77646 [Daldinia sp. EC12]|nr:hypothetical protein K445DRAFT_77646 [Daldinia sp. EC12]